MAAGRRPPLPPAVNSKTFALFVKNTARWAPPTAVGGRTWPQESAAAAGAKKLTDEKNVKSETSTPGETLLKLFHNALRAMARAHHRRGNAQHAQGYVLALLKAKGPISQHDLLETLDVRSASLSEILAKLERNGLVNRERAERDKRGFIISVTEQGRNAAEEHKREHLKSAAAIFAPLSAEEQRRLGEILQKIIAALEKEDSGRDADYEHESGCHDYGHKSDWDEDCHRRQGAERRRSPRWEQHLLSGRHGQRRGTGNE
jgi:DNA-binding MarR family transcriptional regulator